MKSPTLRTRPAAVDVERSLSRLGRFARRETAPPLDVAVRVMAALGRQRAAALSGTGSDEGASPLGWLAAAAVAVATAVALFALPALESLSGPFLELYGLLGGGAL